MNTDFPRSFEKLRSGEQIQMPTYTNVGARKTFADGPSAPLWSFERTSFWLFFLIVSHSKTTVVPVNHSRGAAAVGRLRHC